MQFHRRYPIFYLIIITTTLLVQGRRVELIRHSVRIDNEDDIDNNCDKYAGDNTTMTVVWYDMVPLMHEDDMDMKGLLATLMEHIMHACYGNVSIVYCHQMSDQYSVLQDWTNETIAAPIRRSVAEQVFQLPDNDVLFVPLIKSPGFIYLENEDKDDNPIGSVIIEAWPLALMILLAACFAGIIIWITDRLKNPEQFHKTFSRGYTEGIWWAFVTMTTVGYGDVVPKSLPAKLFGIIWILAGTVLITSFTATMTTSLSANQFSNSVPIDLKDVTAGVLDGTEAALLAEALGATVVVCEDLHCLYEKLHHKNITGIILEFHTALHEMKMGEVQHALTIPQEAMHGFYIRDVPKHKRKCFAKYIRQHLQKFDPTDEPGRRKHASRKSGDVAKSLMETDLTFPILIYGWSLWLFIMLIISAWDCIYKPYIKRKSKDSDIDVARVAIKERSGSQVSTVSMDPFITNR